MNKNTTTIARAKSTNLEAAAQPAKAAQEFPLKPYLNLARTVFEDAQGSNDMGVIADLLESKAELERVKAERDELPGKKAGKR